jgi:protein-serine/threonine kinase
MPQQIGILSPKLAYGRWSLGIILFECLFGYPPFWASTRRATQKIIMDWMNTLEIPPEPATSDTAKRLIKALLSSATSRLRTPTWEIDLSVQRGHPVTAFQRMQVFKMDIRNHYFFRSAKLDFETIHLRKAPCLPRTDGFSRGLSKRESHPLPPGKVDHAEKGVDGIRTKDVMLHDERVLKERRTKAFKDYTYRGPDLGVVLQRFTEAIDTD